MRHPSRLGRADSNQPEIVRALRLIGAGVVSLASIGGGVPDLLVARHGRTVLMEVKTAKGKLNAAQEEFRATWPGAIYTVRTPEDAISVLLK